MMDLLRIARNMLTRPTRGELTHDNMDMSLAAQRQRRADFNAHMADRERQRIKAIARMAQFDQET